MTKVLQLLLADMDNLKLAIDAFSQMTKELLSDFEEASKQQLSQEERDAAENSVRIFQLVGAAATMYHASVVTATMNNLMEEQNGTGLSGTTDTEQGRQGDRAGLPEAGAGGGQTEATEGVEPAGAGGTGGDGAEYGGGSGDGRDEDPRE